MNIELLPELHPSTCEHDKCPPLICKNYKQEPDQPVSIIKEDAVYVAEESTLQRSLPTKGPTCSLCDVLLTLHFDEMCVLQQEHKRKAKESIDKWIAENLHYGRFSE